MPTDQSHDPPRWPSPDERLPGSLSPSPAPPRPWRSRTGLLEAVGILLKPMEDHRDEIVVVVAGHTAASGYECADATLEALRAHADARRPGPAGVRCAVAPLRR